MQRENTQGQLVGICALSDSEDLARIRRAGILCDWVAVVSVDDAVDSEEKRLWRKGVFGKLFQYGLFRPNSMPEPGSIEVQEAEELSPSQEKIYLRNLHDFCLRTAANVMRKSGFEVIPVIGTAMPTMISEDLPKKLKVVRAVLHHLPLPDNDTPWEAIRDWREDEDAKQRFRRLRFWISETARSKSTITEVNERLAVLMDDYRTYMELHHKKLRRGRAEVIVSCAAGVLEDIAHIQPSKAVEKLFSLFREEVSALEAELSAPGREVAYLVAAQDHFDSSKPFKPI